VRRSSSAEALTPQADISHSVSQLLEDDVTLITAILINSTVTITYYPYASLEHIQPLQLI
jgi:hypothetical protein